MDVWDQVNDTLSVVGWPAVVALGLILFRRQIRNLIGRVREGEVLGAKFKVVQVATTEFNERAALVAGRSPDDDHAELDGSGSGADGGDHDAQAEVTQPNGNDMAPREPAYTRDQVQEFVRAAAEAGYAVGASGMFQSEPEPVLGWAEEDDEVPEILYWQSQSGEVVRPPSDSSESRTERIRRLEQEIKALTLQKNSPLVAGMSAFSGERKTIEELQEKLRLLDSHSPWVP